MCADLFLHHHPFQIHLPFGEFLQIWKSWRAEPDALCVGPWPPHPLLHHAAVETFIESEPLYNFLCLYLICLSPAWQTVTPVRGCTDDYNQMLTLWGFYFLYFLFLPALNTTIKVSSSLFLAEDLYFNTRNRLWPQSVTESPVSLKMCTNTAREPCVGHWPPLALCQLFSFLLVVVWLWPLGPVHLQYNNTTAGHRGSEMSGDYRPTKCPWTIFKIWPKKILTLCRTRAEKCPAR